MPFGELLEQHRIALTGVTLHRERLTSTRVMGVVRHFSKRLVLVELIDQAGPGEAFALIRRDDLTRVDWNTTELRRALMTFGTVARTHPIARELDLLDWRTVIASAQRVASRLRLHREGIGDPMDLAPRSIKLAKHLLTGERPDPSGADDGEFALAFDHLTRIDCA